MMKTQINYKVNSELVNKLKKLAGKEKRTITAQLEIILEEYFTEKDVKNEKID